jgi:hypothetical protein
MTSHDDAIFIPITLAQAAGIVVTPPAPQPAGVAWQVDGEIERDEDGIVWTADVESGRYSAFIKRDGCIDLYDNNDGQIHICNLDDLIARLHALKAFAVAQWPDGEGGW